MGSFEEKLQIEIRNYKDGRNTNFLSYRKLNNLDIRQIFATTHEVDLKRDESGMPIPGSGRIVTNDEKKMVFDYIMEHNYPLTRKIYNLILQAYLSEEIELENKQSHKL